MKGTVATFLISQHANLWNMWFQLVQPKYISLFSLKQIICIILLAEFSLSCSKNQFQAAGKMCDEKNSNSLKRQLSICRAIIALLVTVIVFDYAISGQKDTEVNFHLSVDWAI